MANYPTSLDSFTNPSSVDSLSAPSHSLQHADANDAIEALEAKVGIGTSTAGSATAGHVLVASAGGTTSWTTVSAGAISTTGGTAGQYLSAGTAGVAQWADVTPSAETVISTGTFTAVSAVNLSNVLSDTYQFYNLYFYARSTSSIDVFLRFRENTTDSTTGYYAGGNSGNYLAQTGSAPNRNNASNFYLGTAGNGFDTVSMVKITRVSASLGYYFLHYWEDVNAAGGTIAGRATNITNFNGLTFYPNTSTITGKYILTGVK